MSRTPLGRAVRLVLAAASVSGAAYGPAAVAQQTPDTAGQASLEEVVVTGSRIANTALESVSPMQIIGAEEIQSTGVANIQDVLLKTPVFGTPSVSRTNSNFSTSSAGVSTIDLRNLGTARTLVLVNGRRFVAGIGGTSAVDLNVVPTQFIERVDVLTGGASAAYGSDAVAGVVNIIYKRDFQGVEGSVQYGGSSRGDARDKQYNLMLGTTTEDGRGNVMAYLGYSFQGAVYSRDRPELGAAVDQFSTGAGVTGDPADIFVPTVPFYSSFAPQGRFFDANGTSTWTYRDNQLISGFSTNGSATRPADGFNRSAFRTIAIPTTRYLFATRGNFEFTDGVSAFMEGTYAKTKTVTELEPYPLQSSGANGIYPASGGVVPADFAVFSPTGVRSIVRNPIVPLDLYTQLTPNATTGLRGFTFTKRMSDFGNRGQTADRDTFRIVGGFEGSLGERWKWDAYYGFGQTTEAQVGGGQVNVLNFRQALETQIDPVSGQIQCRDAEARRQGCYPANIFGVGTLDPRAIAWIQAPTLYNNRTSQTVAGANLSGAVFDLPAGPFSVAVGTEYRQEKASYSFDPLAQAGLNAGNAIKPTNGRFDVKEAYVETNVPLLKDMPLVRDLSTRLAYRYADYSTVGNVSSWNAGLEWAPVEGLRFRATRATSTRAPNISELFDVGQTFPTGLQDPCRGVTATSTTAASARCRTAPGVATNIAANGAFTLNQSDTQGISGFDRGNPNLKEEVGKSWTAGVVIDPKNLPVLDRFEFSIDWFQIDITDAIVSTPRQFILQQCYTGDASFCSLITRRPTAVGPNSAGSIEFIDSISTNSGGLQTKGIDFTMAFRQDLADWGLKGNFNARLAYTRTISGSIVPAPDSEPDTFAGEIGASKNRALLNVGYSFGPVGVSWQTTYIGAASLDDQFLSQFDDPNSPDPNNPVPLKAGSIGVGAWVYHDVQIKYTPVEKVELYVGANNVFDKKAPPIISGLPGDVTGSETDAGTYDAIGRRYYGGFRVKF